MVTPNDRYYIRTSAPCRARGGRGGDAVDDRGARTGPVAGGADDGDLERLAVKAGPYVMECAGNADPTNYGLMSAAAWRGRAARARCSTASNPPGPPALRQAAGAHRVLVTGLDDPGPAATSVPGASWIFSRDQLDRAILAVRMNDRPLPRNHGSPVRLIVPGWYGCACIKWVTAIELVSDDAQPTSQMWEFARRTHQPGLPELARDYVPAVIDTAATPIRIEKWTVGGTIEYRVIGILWGGTKPTNALSIRFRASSPWTKVDDFPMPKTMDTWTMWTHTWRPTATGRYQ